MNSKDSKTGGGRLLLHPGRFDGCIFDMDGSLVDSMWVWTAIDREFLGRHGYEVPEGFQKDLGGMSLKEMSYYFKKRFSLPASPEEIQEEWNRMAFYKYRHEVPLKPGAEALLAWLKEHHIKAGIATSNSRKLAEALLESLGLSACFQAVVTGDEVTKGKPDPEIYLKASRKMGADPWSSRISFPAFRQALPPVWRSAVYGTGPPPESSRKRKPWPTIPSGTSET